MLGFGSEFYIVLKKDWLSEDQIVKSRKTKIKTGQGISEDRDSDMERIAL